MLQTMDLLFYVKNLRVTFIVYFMEKRLPPVLRFCHLLLPGGLSLSCHEEDLLWQMPAITGQCMKNTLYLMESINNKHHITQIPEDVCGFFMKRGWLSFSVPERSVEFTQCIGRCEYLYYISHLWHKCNPFSTRGAFLKIY